MSDRMTNVRLEIAAAMVVERKMTAAVKKFNREKELWAQAVVHGWTVGCAKLKADAP